MNEQTDVATRSPRVDAQAVPHVSGTAGPTILSCYVDPICPWAWRTACWIREVQRQAPLDVRWKLFSLAIANGQADRASTMPLLTLALVREQGGNPEVERLYFTLGQLIHDEDRDVRSPGAMEAVVEEALDRNGLSRQLLWHALSDTAVEQKLLVEQDEARMRYGVYGVPWLVADDCDFGFQGPVVEPAPTGETAAELWGHVSWLLRQPYFYELKRSR